MSRNKFLDYFKDETVLSNKWFIGCIRLVLLQNSRSCFWTRWNKESRMRRLTTSSSVMHKVFFLDTKLKCKLYIFITSSFLTFSVQLRIIC